MLIAGDIGLNGALKKAWFNLSCVYTALVNKYGFKEITENDQDYYHIMVCANSEVEGAMTNIGPNGWLPYDLNQSGVFPNHDDFNYTYNNKQDIQLVFQNLSGDDNSLENIPVLNEDDQLFVMLCGVGNATVNDTTVMITRGYNPQYLSDSELATWVRNIKCSQMTFLIDCNYAGGFIDNLMNDALAECKNRAVHTSTDRSHYSWAERHITQEMYNSKGSSGNYVVDEYIYYWSAASLGYYPIIEPYYNDHIFGPWHKYDGTTIGQFGWSTFDSFYEGMGCLCKREKRIESSGHFSGYPLTGSANRGTSSSPKKNI